MRRPPLKTRLDNTNWTLGKEKKKKYLKVVWEGMGTWKGWLGEESEAVKLKMCL